MSEIERNPSITRRGVLRAAAWSAPVVAVAVGAPLAAASEAGTIQMLGGSLNGSPGSYTLEMFLAFDPLPAQAPLIVATVWPHSKIFSSVNWRADWNAYQCHAFNFPGTLQPGSQAQVTVTVEGYKSLETSVEVYHDEP